MKPDLIKKIDDKLLNLINSKKPPHNSWSVVIDNRDNIHKEEDKELVLFSQKHCVLMKIYREAHKKNENKLVCKVAIVTSPAMLLGKKLEHAFSGHNHNSYYTDFYRKGFEQEEINPKTEKVQKIFSMGLGYFMIYNDIYSHKLTPEEKEDYQDIYKKIHSLPKDVIENLYQTSTSIHKTSIYAQETKILGDLLKINKKEITQLFQLENLKNLDGNMEFLPHSIEYLFEMCRDNKFTKNKPLEFHNEKFYYFKHQEKEFLYSQSQNSGYLFEKTSTGFEGHIFGYECIRKNLKQLFQSGLSADTLSLKIDDGKITFADTWIDYNSYVIDAGVEQMNLCVTGERESRSTVLENYSTYKRKHAIENMLCDKPKKASHKI